MTEVFRLPRIKHTSLSMTNSWHICAMLLTTEESVDACSHSLVKMVDGELAVNGVWGADMFASDVKRVAREGAGELWA